jgi:UDP-glucose 4-epimerase
MQVFITGGAGYIGSVTAAMLLQAGHSVTIYDSLITGHRAAVPQDAGFIQADLGDSVNLVKALNERRYDAVMHFAAFIEAGESMKNPGKFFRNNLINSLSLIETAFQAGVRRFVLSSTAAVYASCDEPLREDSALGPTNVYGQTKLMVEQTLNWYRQIHGIRYAALRYFNAAGALPERGEDHCPESHLIPLVLRVALGKRPAISIYGNDYPTPDGTNIRDYIHVADLAAAHLLALEALEKNDQMVYNLGNGEGYSVREVIMYARQVTGHPIPANECPRRPGDSARLVASSERIRRELGWQPRYPELKDIIASAWEWHRTHPDGYANGKQNDHEDG